MHDESSIADRLESCLWIEGIDLLDVNTLVFIRFSFGQRDASR